MIELERLKKRVKELSSIFRVIFLFLLGFNIVVTTICFYLFSDLQTYNLLYSSLSIALFITVILMVRFKYCIFKHEKLLDEIEAVNHASSSEKLQGMLKLLFLITFSYPMYHGYIKKD